MDPGCQVLPKAYPSKFILTETNPILDQRKIVKNYYLRKLKILYCVMSPRDSGIEERVVVLSRNTVKAITSHHSQTWPLHSPSITNLHDSVVFKRQPFYNYFSPGCS